MKLSKLGPNQPCGCGSGKKHKKCCRRFFVDEDGCVLHESYGGGRNSKLRDALVFTGKELFGAELLRTVSLRELWARLTPEQQTAILFEIKVPEPAAFVYERTQVFLHDLAWDIFEKTMILMVPDHTDHGTRQSIVDAAREWFRIHGDERADKAIHVIEEAVALTTARFGVGDDIGPRLLSSAVQTFEPQAAMAAEET